MTIMRPLPTDRGRFEALEPVGVIDIGSNSVRLVVYEGATRSPTPLFNEKVLCGLGRSVATTGYLNDAAVACALAALRRFGEIADILGVVTMRAVATAAVREAINGQDFISRGEEACGTTIQVLSGQREAELAAAGIIAGFCDPDGLAGDLGGGSLEITDIAGTTLRGSTTLPLGSLRLMDTAGSKLEKASDIIDGAFTNVGWLGNHPGRPFYAVGGTWRALAKLHMEQTNYPLRVMHGYALPPRDVLEFCQAIRKAKKVSSIKGIESISRARREALPYGALVLERLLKRIDPSEVVFSVFGIREGLVFGLMDEAERQRDPLLSFCEDYARLNSRSVRHAHELCDWTDVIFDTALGLPETPEESRLRHAACLISDIGWRAHPDYRGEQSLNVIAHAALGGIDHPGRVFLALTVYFRHVGRGVDRDRDELSGRLKDMVSKRTLKRTRILGAALRAAHMISIGMPDIIPHAPITTEQDTLVLTLPKDRSDLNGERLSRRFGMLAALLDRQSEVRPRAA